MKKGNDFLVRKYVYRSISGVYYRSGIEYFDYNALVSLYDDFAYIDTIASIFPTFKLSIKKASMELTAWKDKHNNVIVRVIDKIFVQTKINF